MGKHFQYILPCTSAMPCIADNGVVEIGEQV